MMLRNIGHHPLRATFTTLGMALATAILIASLFTRESMPLIPDSRSHKRAPDLHAGARFHISRA